MRKVAAVSLAIVAMAGSNVFAGLATFSPSPQSNVPIGTPAVTMDVSLTATTNAQSGFDTADIVILSDAPFSWGYSSDFTTKSTGSLGTPFDPGLGIKPHELFVGGNTPLAGGYGSSIALGTLTFDTSTLPVGTYEVLVNSDIDGGITSITHFGAGEPITGRGEFTIVGVPEPATIGLLLLGAMGLVRRRFAR